MKRIIIHRVSESPDCSAGALIDASTGLPFAVSLERPWLSNQRDISCIPRATYVCTPHFSKKVEKSGHKFKWFGSTGFNCFLIKNVPGRTNVLIHVFNTVDQSEGCIAPGSTYGSYKQKYAVLSSKDAMQKLIDIVGTEDFYLTIR